MNEILQKRIEEATNIMFGHQTIATEAMKYILQHLWISVEEALPEIVDGYRSALVIVRSKYNSYDVAKWDEYYKDWITPDYAVANVTHWMMIPTINNEEK